MFKRWTNRRIRIYMRDLGRFLDEQLPVEQRDGTYLPFGKCGTKEQRAFVQAIASKDKQIIAFIGSRGTLKTSVIAGVALHGLHFVPGFQLCHLSASKESTKETIRILREMFAVNESLQEGLDVQVSAVLNDATDAEFKILSTDSGSAFPYRPNIFSIDELDCQERESIVEVCSSAITKRPGAKVILTGNQLIGTPWQYDRLETIRKDAEEEGSLSWYGEMALGSMPWLLSDTKMLETQRKLNPLAFRRLFENERISGTGDLCSGEELARCLDETLPAGPAGPKRGAAYSGGLDLGVTRDPSAFVVVETYLQDERRHYRVACMKVWVPGDGDPVPLTVVEDKAREETRRYRCAGVTVDPWQSVGIMERMAADTEVSEFRNVGQRAAEAAALLRQVIVEGTLHFHPDCGRVRDPRTGGHMSLRDDLLNMRVKVNPDGSMRLNPLRVASSHGDQAMALAMCLLGASKRPAASSLTEKALDEALEAIVERAPEFEFSASAGTPAPWEVSDDYDIPSIRRHRTGDSLLADQDYEFDY